jgi:transcriptional regulator with XRE-family HTH domain
MTDLLEHDPSATTSARTPSLGLPQRVAVVCLGGLISLGPITATTSSGAALKEVVIRYSGLDTASGGSWQLIDEHVSASGETIRDLRARSGWTWDELAKAAGVSRRAVHGWATGARVNQAHSMRLQRLAEAVRQYDRNSPPETRAALHAPTANGPSAFEMLVRSARGNSRTSLSPSQLLQAEPDVRVAVDPIVEVGELD